MLAYERIQPEGRCVSPDGHDFIEITTMESPVPAEIICPRCGKAWTVVTFDLDDTGR
jgi:hypothetical protein